MSRSRQIGTAAESAVVEYLRSHGFPFAERRAGRGADDRGDVNLGIPGVVIEVKAEKILALAQYVDEAEAERKNDGAWLGAAWHKRRGKGSAGDWYVTLSGEQFTKLLVKAIGPLSR